MILEEDPSTNSMFVATASSRQQTHIQTHTEAASRGQSFTHCVMVEWIIDGVMLISGWNEVLKYWVGWYHSRCIHFFFSYLISSLYKYANMCICLHVWLHIFPVMISLLGDYSRSGSTCNRSVNDSCTSCCTVRHMITEKPRYNPPNNEGLNGSVINRCFAVTNQSGQPSPPDLVHQYQWRDAVFFAHGETYLWAEKAFSLCLQSNVTNQDNYRQHK